MNYKLLLLACIIIFIGASTHAQSNLTIAEDFMVKSTTGDSYYLFPILDDGKIAVLTFFTTT